MSTIRLIDILPVVLLLSTGLFGQRPARIVWSNVAHATETGELRYAKMVGALGDATPPTYEDKTLQTTVPTPGDMTDFGLQADDSQVLISGRDGNLGVIEHYTRADELTADYVLSSRLTIANADIVGVQYFKQSGTLFYLDSVSKSIRKGSWNGVAALGTVQFSTWATTVQVPLLSLAESKELRAAGSDIVLYPYSHYLESIHEHAIIKENAGAFTTTIVGDILNVTWDYKSMVEGGNTLLVKGFPNTVFEIVEVESSTVNSFGVIPSSGSIQATTTSAFQLGNSYLVRQFGDPVSADLKYARVCIRRVGFSETLNLNVSMNEFQLIGQSVSGGRYHAEVDFRADPIPLSAIIYPAFFALAVGTVDFSVYPIVPIGSNFILDPSVSEVIATTAYVSEVSGLGNVNMVFEISSDPSLIGLVAYGQFAIDDSGALKLTEIGGMLLLPTVPTTAQSGSGNGPSFLKQPPNKRDWSKLIPLIRKRLRKN